MSATTAYTINTSLKRPAAEDYDLLRQKGIDYIQQLGAAIWTDFNVHDPGVTILEILCYALTDLGYRTSFDISDILTPKGTSGPEIKNTFYTARQILTSHPVTLNDYRKLLIDQVPGVHNAWIEPMTGFEYPFTDDQGSTHTIEPTGIYRVKVELDDYNYISSHYPFMLQRLTAYLKTSPLHSDRLPEDRIEVPDLTGSPLKKRIKVNKSEYRECYKNYIRQFLLNYRNICEDFEEVQLLDEITVSICMQVELEPVVDDQTVLAEIYKKVYAYVNPSVKFYTLDQLIEKGKPVEEIFQGSIAGRGFIDYEELKAYDHRKTLYVSDLVSIIMDIKGVISVASLTLSSFKGETAIDKNARNAVTLPDPRCQSFRFYFDDIDSEISLRKNHIAINKGQLCYFAPPVTGVIRPSGTPSPGFIHDLPLPKGRNRNLDSYYSIQSEFPGCYKLGAEGISARETDLRKAQRMQLKAYLLFFDQLLADYLAQLNAVKHLFSWGCYYDEGLPSDEFHDPEHEAVYLFKFLSETEIPGITDLLTTAAYQKYAKIIEKLKVEKDHRNRLLDHLLARFNEKFVEYTLVKFNNTGNGASHDHYTATERIANKIDFLKHYPEISANRSHAINYAIASSKDNFTMAELRISKALGIDTNDMSRNLAKSVLNSTTGEIELTDGKYTFIDDRFDPFETTFGLHIYEHILLRPPTNTLANKCKFLNLKAGSNPSDGYYPDPYSMMTTVVLPGWLSISAHVEFRQFVERLIRTEMPAHTAIKICWIDPVQMVTLEQAFRKFLGNPRIVLSTPPKTNEKAGLINYIENINLMVSALTAINNMYPPSYLEEIFSVKPGEEPKSPFILNYSQLYNENPPYTFVKQ